MITEAMIREGVQKHSKNGWPDDVGHLCLAVLQHSEILRRLPMRESDFVNALRFVFGEGFHDRVRKLVGCG